MKNLTKIIFLLFLTFLMSCSEDFRGGNRVNPETQSEEAVGIMPTRFSTRLNSSLLISGEKCRGTETTGTFGNGERCQARQYLVVIDTINTCEANNCTNDIVSPIVADLINTNAGPIGSAVFEIRARSVTTSEQENILETVLVKSDSMGNGQVFSRFP